MDTILEREGLSEDTISLMDKRENLRQLAKKIDLKIENSSQEFQDAWLCDLSRSGFRIRVHKPWTCGEWLTLHPAHNEELTPLKVRICRVQIIRRCDGDLYDLGLKIADEFLSHAHPWYLYFSLLKAAGQEIAAKRAGDQPDLSEYPSV